jgi:hypothetical protein
MENKVKYILFSLVFLFFACDKSEVVKNAPADIVEGETLARNFYTGLLEGDPEKRYQIDPSITDEFNEAIQVRKTAAGMITDVQMVKIETSSQTINGHFTGTTFIIELKVEYEKMFCYETIGLKKDARNRITVFSYHSKQLE